MTETTGISEQELAGIDESLGFADSLRTAHLINQCRRLIAEVRRLQSERKAAEDEATLDGFLSHSLVLKQDQRIAVLQAERDAARQSAARECAGSVLDVCLSVLRELTDEMETRPGFDRNNAAVAVASALRLASVRIRQRFDGEKFGITG